MAIAWRHPGPLKLQLIKIVAEYSADLDPDKGNINTVDSNWKKMELTRIRLTFTADDMNTDDGFTQLSLMGGMISCETKWSIFDKWMINDGDHLLRNVVRLAM